MKIPVVIASCALIGSVFAAPATADLPVKGEAGDDLLTRVRAAGVAVEVVDHRPHSWLELEERSVKLNHRLVAIGFQDVVTSFDETTSTVEAVATRRPNLPAKSVPAPPA